MLLAYLAPSSVDQTRPQQAHRLAGSHLIPRRCYLPASAPLSCASVAIPDASSHNTSCTSFAFSLASKLPLAPALALRLEPTLYYYLQSSAITLVKPLQLRLLLGSTTRANTASVVVYSEVFTTSTHFVVYICWATRAPQLQAL